MKKFMVLQVAMEDDKTKKKALKAVARVDGVDSVTLDVEQKMITVTGEADPVSVTLKLRKHGFRCAELLSVWPYNA